MVKTPWLSAVVLLAAAGATAAPQEAPNVFESSQPATPAGELDRLVLAKLKSLGIRPALCSDAVFVRRAYLDVIGTLPTAQEARDFIDDPDTKNKRRRLIDRLLERDELADYWSMRWGDILRIKAEFPVNLWPNAAQAYHHWVRSSIANNKPYDQFVRELLTSSGSNFRVGPVNFYRAVQNKTPEGIATAVALTLMGSRAESWPKERLAGMAVFFSQIGYKPTREWKEEHVFWDPFHTSLAAANSAPGQPADKVPPAATAPPVDVGPLTAVFPDGTRVQLAPDRDPREVFADWLVSPKNPWFAKCIVNRVWYWLLGRGIIHEPDDIRDDNPPSNPELLAYLEKELIASRYDLRHLYRLILNSSTYQFSSMPRFTSPEAEANFASYRLRRLDAEVLIDAINKVTGASDLYTSPIPEPFTYIPRDMPAIAIGDGSITSPFLALFGRSARATGMANERDNKPVPAQWLYMLNSSQIQAKLVQGPKLKALFDSGRKPEEIVEELYLTILSRRPTAEEVRIAEEYGMPVAAGKPSPASKGGPAAKPGAGAKPGTAAKSGGASRLAPGKAGKSGSAGQFARSAKPTQPPRRPVVRRRDDWVDVAWALINSMEFLYRH
jgi:hypothetical protein